MECEQSSPLVTMWSLLIAVKYQVLTEKRIGELTEHKAGIRGKMRHFRAKAIYNRTQQFKGTVPFQEQIS